MATTRHHHCLDAGLLQRERLIPVRPPQGTHREGAVPQRDRLPRRWLFFSVSDQKNKGDDKANPGTDQEPQAGNDGRPKHI